jgi:hypothetical protein
MRSSAAIMNAGNESINQGITSLAALAKGYADEQKGIAVSNAVADMSNATNEADLGSAFAAHSANLKDHGIDLKELIAARQAQHTSNNSDAELAARQALNASAIAMNNSTIAGNDVRQAGDLIDNNTKQGVLDNQVQAFGDAHNTVLSNIANNNAQTAIAQTNANTNASQAKAAINELALKRSLVEATEKAQNRFVTLGQDVNYRNADGTSNMGMIVDTMQKEGYTIPNIGAGKQLSDNLGDRANKLAAAAKEAEVITDRETKKYEQTIKDAGDSRKASLKSRIDGLDTDTLTSPFGGGDREKFDGASVLTSAYAAQARDDSGKMGPIPTTVLDKIYDLHSSSGDIKTKEYTKDVEGYVAMQEQKYQIGLGKLKKEVVNIPNR